MRASQVQTNDSDIIILGLYSVFFVYHLLNRGVSYRGHHKALPWHTLSGAIEIALYYGGFKCSISAVTATLIHSLTSLVLVKDLKNGYPPHTRPAYQAGSIMRPIQILHAYYTQSPTDYHDAVMPIHAFVYTRAIIFLLGTMGPTKSFLRNVNSRFVYTQAIFGGALIATSHCSRPEAVMVYLVIMHAVGKVSLWASTQCSLYRERNIRVPVLVRFLVGIGFCTVGELSGDAQVGSDQVPQIGYLPMDIIGHRWARVN